MLVWSQPFPRWVGFSPESASPLRFFGPYVLTATLGRGGMATVDSAFRLDPPGRGSPCAIKRMVPRYQTEPRYAAMFQEEARILSRFQHSNIVQFIEFACYDGELALVMERVDGWSCCELLHHARDTGERLPEAAALAIVDQVLEALEHVHATRPDTGGNGCLVHRDVSPGNILIARSGDIKLIDFGIASWERPAPAAPTALEGKPGYVAPEQAEGGVDRRSDVFAAAVVLAELLIGARLFGGRSVTERLVKNLAVDLGAYWRGAHRVPSRLHSVLVRALSARPEARPATIAELRAELLCAAGTDGVSPSRGVLAAWLRQRGPGSARIGRARASAAARRAQVTLPSEGGRA